jgi:trigger factor
MEIKETLSEGLQREYSVVINNDIIRKKYQARAEEIASQVEIKGFRKGKAPLAIIYKKYEQEIGQYVLEGLMDESYEKILKEYHIEPATTPKVNDVKFKAEEDFNCTIALEIMPNFPEIDLSTIKLEKYIVEPREEEVAKSLDKITEIYAEYIDTADDYKAKNGDQVTISFVGKHDGKEFEGGQGNDVKLILGSESFIPGFEEQLIGMGKNDARNIKVTFPADYPHKTLAGQEVEFEVKTSDIKNTKRIELTDEVAKEKFQLDSVEEMKKTLRDSMVAHMNENSRIILKKDLFDILEDKLQFDIPKSLEEEQYKELWGNFEASKKKDPNYGSDKSEEEYKKEFESLAKRRVKLGLFLLHLGKINKIEVTNQEISQAIMRQAANYPGMEEKVIELYKNNAEMVKQLQGPLFEDKVVDFILEKVDLKEIKVSAQELQEKLFAL